MKRRDLIVGSLSAISLLNLPGLLTQVANAAPLRAIGVNYFDLFTCGINGASKGNLVSSLKRLRDASIPFARFSASPYWPIEWKKSFLKDKSAYLGKLDSVVLAAESAGFGLVPNLIWNPVSISDIVGEPVSYWGKLGSKTLAFMQDYVGTLVKRYAGSSAVWMWEFANEYNDFVDLPNALNWWPTVNVSEGTPSSRSKSDLLTSDALVVAINAFVEAVRQYDSKHPISGGTNHPRYNSFHLSKGSWEPDSEAEWGNALVKVTPPLPSATSIHLYPDIQGSMFKNKESSYSDVLSILVNTTRKIGSISFLGEFGVLNSGVGTSDQRQFTALLSAIVNSGVQYACLWVYDFSFQNSTWNVTFDNARAYQLKMISQANRSFGW